MTSDADRSSSMTVDPALQRNVDAFYAQLDGLLVRHPGKYVVFAHSRLIEVCNSLSAAITTGYAQFGDGQFLVHRVEPLRTHLDFQATCRV